MVVFTLYQYYWSHTLLIMGSSSTPRWHAVVVVVGVHEGCALMKKEVEQRHRRLLCQSP